MKKGLLSLSCLFVLAVASALPAHAQMKAGVGVAFGSDVEAVGITGNFYTAIASVQNLRVGGDLIYYFMDDAPGVNNTALEININGQYVFYNEMELTAYGLGGLSIGYFKSKWDSPIAGFDGSVDDTEVGLNLGAGLEYALGGIDAFGELKFTIGGFEQAVFSAGLRFPLGGR